MISHQSLSTLIGSIYDCVLDPSLWDSTLEKLRDAFNGQTAMLHLTDLHNGRHLIEKTVGIERSWLEEQAKHNVEVVARLTEHVAAHPSLDVPHIMSRHLSQEYLDASPYVQTVLKPGGIVDIIEYFLIYSPTRFAGLGVGRTVRQGVITDRDIELGNLLLPHIRRTVTISNVLDANVIERARMAEALDGLRCAVILTDADGIILNANRVAQSILASGNLVRDFRGALHANLSSAASELRSVIGLAARGDGEIGRAGLAIRLTSPEILPIFAHVLPLTSGDLRTRLQPSAAAAVFIGLPFDEQEAAEVMSVIYELTPAETRVLASLLAGRTLAETSATLSIAASTANTHLDRIFSKTGVNRQADLMRLGGRLVSPISAPHPSV
jgi:DNA-binding CsgD family transcriptional regulator/PAS domain-containing protein